MAGSGTAAWWFKRKLTPRQPIEGAMARRDRGQLAYRVKNAAALRLSRKVGIGVAEARAVIAFSAAAGLAPVAHDRPTEG